MDHNKLGEATYSMDDLLESMRACTDSFNETGSGRVMTEKVGLPFDELNDMCLRVMPVWETTLFAKGLVVGLHLAQTKGL